MINYPFIQAVMRVRWQNESNPLFPDRMPLWEFADDREAWSFIRLSAQTTDLEIGLFFAQLIELNDLESQGNLVERLTEIVDYKSVDDEEYAIISGGLEVIDRHLTISPSCCCGLETWREWTRFLSTSKSPWMGHDPTPFLTLIDSEIVRVSLDDDLTHIDLDRELFRSQLTQVQKDLADFLLRTESWSQDLGFPEPKQLSAKLDRFFSISQDWNI